MPETKEATAARQAVIDSINKAREKMRDRFGGVGEPCIEVPIEHIGIMKTDNNELRAIIGMDKLVWLVDRALRD